MIILDSSAAIRAVLSDDGADAYSQIIASDERFSSPSLFASETANALWKEVRFNELPVDLLPHMRRTLFAMTTLVPDEAYIDMALDIAISEEHPVYDCLFIAMGRSLNAPILTADKKLQRKFPDDKFVAIET